MFGARMLNRHAALMNRMAETVGVDLTEAISEGRLTGEGWRDAVIACTGCSDPEDCITWLALRDGEPAEATPAYCANARLMEELRAEVAPKACCGCGCKEGA